MQTTLRYAKFVDHARKEIYIDVKKIPPMNERGWIACILLTLLVDLIEYALTYWYHWVEVFFL